MVTKKRYPSLNTQSSINPFKISLVVFAFLILFAFFYEANQIIGELRVISEGQQVLVSRLTLNEPQILDEATSNQTEIATGEYVSKVEFIKFRNQTRKTIRDLTKDLRLVQSKLRMKQTILDKY